MTLKGKRIVVLGGSSRIGLATAQAAAREGAQVVIASSRKARIESALANLPKGSEGHALDLADGGATQAFFAPLGAFIARGYERERFAAVLELQVHRQPYAIAQIFRWLELDLREACEGNPVVAPVHEGLEHGAEAHVGIGEPFEGLAVERARAARRGVEGPRAQVSRHGLIAAGSPQQ